MLSTEGPALAVGDLNHDGLDDVFIGAAKNHRGAVYFQGRQGQFAKASDGGFQSDSSYEDVDACIVDVNNDGLQDLIVASGGDEYTTLKKYLQPRLYLNDGKQLVFQNQAFQNISTNASCIVPADFNGDGFVDLFVGGRAVPWEYGQTPVSFLLVNDGKGNFTNVTSSVSKELARIGMVTGAAWTDIDKDGDPDLVLSMEWGGIKAFINDHGKFTMKAVTDRKGWWNFVLPVDVDNDGDVDLIAGNLGENTMLKASPQEPVKLYYTDFDASGKKEQLMTYFLDGKEIPFASIDELEKKIPSLKKKFLYARDFAKAPLADIFPPEKLRHADSLSADLFSSMVFINDGKMNFEARPLPWEAQLSTFRTAVVVDANGDQLPDILMLGNYYDNNIQMGRSDADFGTILLNQGKGQFSCTGIPGLAIKGQVRQVRKIKLAGADAFVLARNNDSARVIRFKGKR
jgi:enediyne biosynthesis protein E4